MDKLMDMAVGAGKSYIDLKSNFQSLKRKWQALESKASDIDEEVSKAELSGKKKRKREVDNWLKEVEKIKTEFPQLEIRVGGRSLGNLMTGGGVENMEKRVIELMEQSQHFNGLLLDNHGNRGEPRLTTKLFGKMFEQNLERILKCLVTDGISSVGIYGMEGVGKTTLAKHVHNFLLEKTRSHVYWFTISQNFSMKRLQNQIAKVVGLDISDEKDEEIRASKLSRVLIKIKNFVLIFDDVWEDFSLKNVGIPLGATGGRVILTTRTEQLCDKMDCQRKFLVSTLHFDEAWDLFKHTLGHGTTLDADTEKIAKFITERCDGLPLGIITMAASMKGITDIRQWRDALQQQKHLDDLMAQVAQLRRENSQIITSTNATTQHYFNVEAENSVLRAQMGELRDRLRSLNESIELLSGFAEPPPAAAAADGFMNDSWNHLHVNQPVMASADMFQY